MAKFSLRDYCRQKLPCNYSIKDEAAKETVILRGAPVRTTPEALADHAEEFGIKGVKFPEDQVTESKTGKLAAGACSGEVARALVEGWLAAEEAAPKEAPKPAANGSRIPVPAK